MTWTKLVYQSHYRPQALHRHFAVAASNTTTSAPIVSGYPGMSAQEITDYITPIILYLKLFAANMTLYNILLMLPYDTDVPLQHM